MTAFGFFFRSDLACDASGECCTHEVTHAVYDAGCLTARAGAYCRIHALAQSVTLKVIHGWDSRMVSLSEFRSLLAAIEVMRS